MSRELWERAESLEKDLRLLHSLNMWVQRYMTHLNERTVSGEIPQILATVEGIIANARTIPKAWLEELNSLAFDLEVPFAIAREARRDFTGKEMRQVSKVMQKLASMLETMIQRIEADLFATWERIGESSDL